jgi:hypothetical protein
VIFTLSGVFLQALAISRSVTFNREKLAQSSAAYSENHQNVRETALGNSNEENIERLKLRMVKAEI